MKIELLGEKISLEGLEEGAYSVNILMRVTPEGIYHFVDIGGYVKSSGESLSLLKEEINSGDEIIIEI